MVDHGTGTRTRILDAAQAMIQTRGYNAVSFRDLAAKVKIKPASIHYYFPNKEDLGTALVERYREFFSANRAAIDASGQAPMKQLERYVQALREGFRQTGRMCLCGILAAEASTLPSDVVRQIQAFFEENERWLAQVLAAGRRSGEMRFQGPAEKAAAALLAGLEGALLSAWTFKDDARLAFAGQWLVEGLKV